MADGLIRNAVAEAVGALILVSATLLVMGSGATPRGLTYGFVVAALVAGLGHVSGGHFNPAVTLAMLLARQVDILGAVAYWVAQLIGGAAGALMVMLVTEREAVAAGTPGVVEDMTSVGGAIALEAIFTMAIVLVVFGAIVDDRAPISAYPFAIGLTVSVGAFATDMFTGAALNPIRGFGPAVVGGEWDGIASWLAGPLIGAVLAWALYTYVIAPGGGSTGARKSSFPEPIPPPPGPSLLP